MTQQVQAGELTLNIPECYRPMTEDEAARYYLGQPAATAWLDEEAGATVRIDQTGRAIPAEGLEALLVGYVAQYQRMAPGFVQGEVLVNDAGNVGVITFKSNAPTRDVFNVFGVIDVAGQEYDVLAACDIQDALEAVKFWSEELLHVLDEDEPEEAPAELGEADEVPVEPDQADEPPAAGEE